MKPENMNHRWIWSSIAATSAPLAPSGHLLGDVATKTKSTTDLPTSLREVLRAGSTAGRSVVACLGHP